jgi:hypothetical protein
MKKAPKRTKTHHDTIGWHRHLLREMASLDDGWVLGESARGVLVQFDCLSDRHEFVSSVGGRNIVCLPLPDLKVYVCLPYTPGCPECDRDALYKES